MAAPTNFGKELRIHRIRRDETLYKMATALGVSSAFLSGVETGSKKASDSLVSKLVTYLSLGESEEKELRQLARETGKTLTIELESAGNEGRSVAALFARRFENGEIEQLRTALTKDDNGEEEAEA